MVPVAVAVDAALPVILLRTPPQPTPIRLARLAELLLPLAVADAVERLCLRRS